MEKERNGAEKIVKKNRYRRIWKKIAGFLGCCVVFCTTYALILPALTMERDCGMEEHVHGEECYVQVTEREQVTLACSFRPHVHSEECGESCGYSEYVLHSHGGLCYENGSLVCEMEECTEHIHAYEDTCYQKVHTHTNECYEILPGELICQIAEEEGHAHGEDCYEMVLTCILAEEEGHSHIQDCYSTEQELVCQLEEDETHTHGEDCYSEITTLQCQQEERDGHSHKDGCFEANLTCSEEEKEGHTHGRSCYEQIKQLICEEDATALELVCEEEEIVAHVHEGDCFGEDGTLACAMEEVVEHVHGEECLKRTVQTLDTESLTCTLAEDETHSHGARCYGTWVLQCTMQEHTHTEQCRGVKEEEDAAAVTEASGETEAAAETTAAATEAAEATETTEATAATEATEGTEPAAVTEPGETGAEETQPQEEGALTVEVAQTDDSAAQAIPTEFVDGNTFTSAEGNTLTWEITHNTLTDEYTLTIEGEGAIPDYTNTREGIPWKEYNKYYINLVFGKEINRIGDYALSTMSVIEIEDWGGVTSVGKSAFGQVGWEVRFGGAIGTGQIMRSVILPDGIKSVEDSAFGIYGDIHEVELNEGLESLGNNAIRISGGKRHVHIPSTLVTMTGNSIYGVESYTVSEENLYFCAVDGILYNKDMTVLVEVPTYRELDEFTVPDTVTEIAEGALSGLIYVSKVTIPNSVTVFPTGLIGNSNVVELYFEQGTVINTTGAMINGCDNLSIIQFPEDTQFELDSILGYNNFMKSLESFKIPRGVTKIVQLNSWYGSDFIVLKDLLYDAADAAIGTTGDPNNPVKNRQFGANTFFHLTFGPNVDNIRSGFGLTFTPHCLSFSFKGPNSFVVQEGGFADAPAPFTDLHGLFYVDEQGLVYLCDAELKEGAKTKEATLIYCQPDITTATVPEKIYPDGSEGEVYTVTRVRKDALKWAEDLGSITFEDLTEITQLETASLANCPSLTEVNGETTVEEAEALFAGADVGYNTFYNTGLAGAPGTGTFDEQMNGSDQLNLTGESAAKISIVASGEGLTWAENEDGTGGYRTQTGQSVIITTAVNNTEEGQTARYRVYFRTTSEEATDSIVLGENDNDVEFSGLDVSYHATQDPYTKYVEFGLPEEGETAAFTVNCSYPNIVSAGGGLTVWGVILGENEEEGSLILSEDTLQVSWTTQADNFAVSKTPTATDTIGVISDGSYGAKPSQALGWKIKLNRVEETTSAFGKDHATGAEFTDIMTLPAGVRWEDSVAAAIENKTIKARGNDLYAGDIRVASISLSGTNLYLRARSLTQENGQYVLRWGMNSSQQQAEMNAAEITVTIYADALRIDAGKESGFDPDALATVTNDVWAKIHYTYREDAEYSVDAETGEVENPQLHATATRNISGGAGNMNFQHTSTVPKYFGENVDYTLHIYNTGALEWSADTVDENAGYTLRENLDRMVYITPDNMVRMFEEEEGLVITITGAELGQWETADGVDGTAVILHQGNSDSIEKTTGNTLTITEKDGTYTVSVTGGSAYSGTDLKELLQQAGYVVTSSAQYSCTWPLSEANEAFTLLGGEHLYYYVYATVKDTFQGIYTDWHIQYSSGGQASTSSRADILRPNGNSYTYRTRNYFVRRETVLGKNVYRDGESLPSSWGADHGDVLDYQLSITHYGTGNHENLPMVDHLCGSQYLLAPVIKENAHLDGLTIHEDEDGNCYYVLTKGTYQNVYVGVDDDGNKLLAASIEVKEAELSDSFELDGETRHFAGMYTKINWYFPEIPSGTYRKEITYQALVDLDLSGQEYALGNVVLLNDRTDDRLYASLWGGGTRLGYDKAIVLERGSSPEEDVLAEDDYSAVSAGEKVTYRLAVSNYQDISTVLNGKNMADGLPASAEFFLWEKGVNISGPEVVAGEGAQITWENLDDWEVGTQYGGLVGTRQYILWSEEAQISFQGPGTVYLYITLTYPEHNGDNSPWEQYTDMVRGGRIYNDFYLYRYSAGVEHDLKESGRVLLQKGVYGNYHYGMNGNNPDIAGMKPSNSRLYYNNEDFRMRSTAYYVVLYNDSNKRVYLNDLHDKLPEGFTFLKFITDAGSVTSSGNTKEVTVKGGIRNVLTQTSSNAVETIVYKSAKITADTTDGLKFIISAGTGSDAVRYDSERKQYYLEKGEAIEFGYCVRIGTADMTQDSATNVIAMAYEDYLQTGVSVVGKEEVFITAAEQPYFFDENDGSRITKTEQQMIRDYGISGGENWLVSEVTMHRGGIVPGVTKYTDSYMQDWNGPVTTYTNQVNHDSIVNWRVRLHNSGTLAMTDYTFRDVMPYPYSFAGDIAYTWYGVDDFQGGTTKLLSVQEHIPEDGLSVEVTDLTFDNRKKTVTINGDAVAFGREGREFYVSIGLDEHRNEVLTIRFEGRHLAILEGGHMDLTLSSVNKTGRYAYSVYTNQAILEPEQAFTSVAQGSVVRDENGQLVGAKNASSITVSIGFATSSEKKVEETGNSKNCSGAVDYIVLPDKSSVFTYRLTVWNDIDQIMNKLVILDNLPDVGDHNPFDTNTDRGSEFRVSLADEPKVSVYIIPAEGDPYVPGAYTVEYSTGTDFGGPQSEHWMGEAAAADDPTQWTKDTAGARSIRVVINDKIPKDARVEVAFNATADAAANPGETAWNSFGYHYGLENYTIELEAMSAPVGVRVPSIPSLVKRIVDSNGMVSEALEDSEFAFVLYEGDALEGTYDTEESLTAALSAAGRNYRRLTLTVEAGKSVSQTVDLCWDDWTWQAGETYTVAELPVTEQYSFQRFYDTSAKSYTFAYDPAFLRQITCVNTLNSWTIRVRKVNENREPLDGAVFALYSPTSEDRIHTDQGDIPEQIEQDGRALYLAETGISGEEGLLEWKDLLREYYYLMEIKAPDGYNLSDPAGMILYRTSAVQTVYELEIVNTPGYELPKSGGIGTEPMTSLGPGLMLAAVLFDRKRRRKTRN